MRKFEVKVTTVTTYHVKAGSIEEIIKGPIFEPLSWEEHPKPVKTENFTQFKELTK